MTREEIQVQEERLQFDKFDNDTAFKIGESIVKKAMERNLAVTVDITRCRQQLFHIALPGTAADNDEWLKRKVNTVYRFGKSSLSMELELKEKNTTMEEAYYVSSETYVAAGGAFPVRIRNTGLIGTIGVSGLASSEDHALVVESIEEYLG